MHERGREHVQSGSGGQLEDRLGFLAMHPHRLLADDMLAVAQRIERVLGVGVGRCDHDHDVDVGRPHLVGGGDQVRIRTPPSDRVPAVDIASVDRAFPCETPWREPIEDLQVGREHVARTDESDPDARSPRIVTPGG